MAKRKSSKAKQRKTQAKADPSYLQRCINEKFDKMPPIRRSLRIAGKVSTLKLEKVEANRTTLTATVTAATRNDSTKNASVVSKRTTNASKVQLKCRDVIMKVEDAGKPKKRRNQSIEATSIRRSLRGRKEVVPTLETNVPTLKTALNRGTQATTTIFKKPPVYLDLDRSTSCENLISSNGTLSIVPNRIQTTTVRTTRLRSVSICAVMPNIRRRTHPITEDISQIHSAKSSLHLSKLPNTLPCRENECKEIFELIKGKLLDNSGGCMYVCGVPGTGKTATLSEVIRSLRSKGKNLPDFELIEVNGMQLTEPQQAYVHIYHHLKGIKVRWDEAVSLLEKYFNNPTTASKPTILVADEFDTLKSSGQRVIYNLLNWAMKPSAQLFVVAIGNIVDVERMGGITSRLGSTRFTFLPYTQSQLQRIVQARLAGMNIYENDAVELVARKVASISGDCRRALDICRRAIEIGEKDCHDKNGIRITTSHVVQAFDEMIGNPKLIALKGCSKYEKFFLQAVVAEIARTGADETVLFQVYKQFETICGLNGVSVPEPGIALRISSRLGSSRLLICEHSSNSIHQKIMLNVTEDEMRHALDQK